MKRFTTLLFACLLAFSMALGIFSPASAADLCVNTDGSGGCYTSIQAAIAAASSGDVIHVAAGTYAEKITIDKPLTLSGAGAGLSIIDGTSFGSPTDFVIDITTLIGETRIEGFDILTGDWNTGIHSSGGTDAAGKIEILNNHIISTNSDLSGQQYGIIAGYLDVRKLIISGNEISNTYDNSILVELQMGETEITNNVFNGPFPSVFFMTYDGHDVTPSQKVSGNTFDMSGAEIGSGAAAIGINPSTYYVDLARRTGKYVDFEISNNTITGISDISIKGISVGENSADGIAGGVTNLNIFGNTISGTDGKGIQLYGHITGADIHDNTLTGLAQGMRIFTYASSFYPENNDIYNNQISGASTYLINYEGTAPIDLGRNWWGTADGTAISPLMTTGVVFNPWCAESSCTTFLDVTPGMSIQAAINAADDGDTIYVAAGTYAEVLQIYKPITLAGAGIGSTIINASASGGYGMDIMANDVNLNNFTFIGPSSNVSGRYGIKVSGPAAPVKGVNFDISNVTIQDCGRTGLDINGMDGVTITNVTVTNTIADNKANGVALTDVDNATLTNVTTSGNNWGGVAIYTYGRYYTGGSSNITLTNIVASEPAPVYIETGNFTDPANPIPVVNFIAPQFGYTVHNPIDRLNHAFYQETKEDAIAFALALPHPASSYIIQLSDGALVLAPGMSIQAAIDAAAPGTTINVPAGTYTEQVFINKSLHLIGENRDTTIIQAPGTIPASGDPNSTIVKIFGAGVDVELTGFTISGPGPSGCGSINAGIIVRDEAHANIHDNKILDIRDEPLSGCQNGVGIIVGRNLWATTGTADITNNIISGFQKNGMLVDRAGSSATITGNTVTGSGPLGIGLPAQNGIQVSRGANATINNNTISDISYTPAGTSAAGILLYQADTVTATGNTLTNVQDAIDSYFTANSTITNNTITSTTTGLGNPAAGVWGIAITSGTVTASGNTITNDGTTGGMGLTVYGGYDDQNTNVTLTGNSVSGWETGVLFEQCTSGCGTGVFTGIVFSNNQIVGNTTQIVNSGVDPAVPASPNWWGSAVNPGFDTDLISYSPWCADYACTTFAYLSSALQDELDNLPENSTYTLLPGILDSGLILSVPGTTLILNNGSEIRPEYGPCFLVNADNVTIKAETPGGALCVAPTWYNGLEMTGAVDGLTLMNMEFDGSANYTSDGVNIGYDLNNFLMLNNLIHDFERDGLRFAAGASLTGNQVIMGNSFNQNDGYGINNLTPTTLTAIFNGWGDVKGPKGLKGDGYYGKLNVKSYTNADLLATSSGTPYANKVAINLPITYAVKVNAASLGGAEFDLEFDSDLLDVISITDSGKLLHDASCVISTAAEAEASGIIHYCGKGKTLNGSVTLFTVKFQAKADTATTTLDFVDDSVSFASVSTGASNFIYPGTLSDVSLTIFDPGSAVFDLSGKILLEGRSDASGSQFNLAGPGLFGPSDKWGNLNLTGLVAGSYAISVTRDGYIDLPAAMGKMLVVNAGKTTVRPLTLIAGDVNNNEKIDLPDILAVVNEYGHSGAEITNALADINGDGTVNLLDLVLVGKNYNKTSSAYKSWKP